MFPASLLGFAAGSVGYNIALSGMVALGTNMSGFLIAMMTKTHKITDLVGCGTFAISAITTHAAVCVSTGASFWALTKPALLTLGVTFWSVRLGGFLFYRILQTGSDKRLDPFYNAEGEPWLTGPAKYPLKLLGFWTIQSAWAWVVLLPVTVAQSAAAGIVPGAWTYFGLASFALFFLVETGADFQKDWFKRQPGNKDEFVRTGFYYWCQYPNYFAEISVWWSMFLWAGFPGVFAAYPYIIASPVFTTLLLRWGSGVANLSHYQKARYGHREDYQAYVATTPVLLPFMKPFYASNVPSGARQPLVSSTTPTDDE